MRTYVLLLVACVAAVSGACGDDPKRPAITDDGPAYPSLGGGGGSSGGLDGGTSDGGDAGDGGLCTDLANTGKPVDQMAFNSDLPPGTGGTILDGTYDLIDARVYQGVTGVTGFTGTSYQGSIRITGSTFERVLLNRTGAGRGVGSETHARGTLTSSGTSATITLTCPFAMQEQVTYTAVNQSLTLSNVVTKESFVFTRQP